RRSRPTLRQAGALGFLAVTTLHIGAEAAGAQGDFLLRLGIGAENLVAVLHAAGVSVAFAVFTELAGKTAFGIVRAADERAISAELQRQVAGAAFRADARVRSVLARREQQRGEIFVERVDDIRDAQFLDVVDRGRKIVPEVAQNIL